MATTKEITIGYGRTVNTGNYQSERFDLSAKVEMEPGEDENEAVANYYEWIKGIVDALANEAITKVNG